MKGEVALYSLRSAQLAVVTTGWKWTAVLIGLAAIVVLFGIVAVMAGSLKSLIEGYDGLSSTSKFQWLLWLILILFAYVTLWVLRAKGGDYTAIPNAPANVLTVLGFSTVTAVAAKGITASYVKSNRITKGSAPAAAAAAPPEAPGPAATGGIFQDDAGVPELAKIQMVAFTFVAIGIYIATVIHQIASTPVITTLPDIDKTLMVLMGVSQGGYLGKKLVSF